MANIAAGGRIDGPLGFTGFGTGFAGGDFNRDGVADLAITYQLKGSGRGDSAAFVQIIYGGDSVFDGEVASGGLLGGTVTTTGETDIGVGIDVPGPLEFADFNGDGGADLLIGAPRAQSSSAETGGAGFALFGAEGTEPFAFTLANLTDGVTGSGFTATGGQNTGSVFTNLRDIDNDGEDEFFIGAPFSPSPGGASLSGLGFVFTPNGDAATDLAAAPAGLETTLFGDELTFLAEDAAGVGDVNGDGIADFVVSGRGADGAGTGPLTLHSGEAYLIFGANGGLGSTLDVSTLDGTMGVRIIGSDTFTVNSQIESAGDVNGDGLGDFLLQDDGATTDAPLFYLVYGTDDDFGATFDISTAPANRVSTFGGVASSSTNSGVDMAGVGDVNGDGFDDILLSRAEGGPSGAGEAALLFGSAAGFGASVDLDDIADGAGYRFQGTDYNQRVGYAVTGPGDLNGDGINDLAIGASTFNPPSNSEYTVDAPGAVFVVYGGADAFAALDAQSGSDGVISLGDVTGIVSVPDDQPAIFSLGADAVVSEADGTFRITVTRSSDVGAAEISLGVAGATADVTRIGGLNTFADGEASKEIIFRIEQDTLAEADETVDFTLSVVSSDQPFELGDVTQRVTITDDDAPVEYTLGADQMVSEGEASFGVFVTRSSGEGAAEIDLSFTGSASSSGDNPDFTRIGGTNLFADGETQKLITYRIEQDTLREPDEQIFFQLSVTSADQPTTLGDAFQTVTIIDNDEPTVFSLGADFSVSEAEAADRTFAITVTRSSDIGAAEVSLTPTGTADSADFSRIGGSDTFADGETTTSVLYRVEADALTEPDETISFALDVVSSDQPFLFDDATQVVTIVDDDEPTVFSLGADFSVSEAEAADRTFAITVTRSSDVGAAEVSLTPAGTADSADFSRIGGSDTFADGETTTSVLYRVEADALNEPDETISFALEVVSSDQPVLFDDTTQVVTILDDDEPTIYTLRGDAIVRESDGIFFVTITRNNDEGAAKINLARTGAVMDVERISGSDTFADGETVKQLGFQIVQDTIPEPNEIVDFELFILSSDRPASLATATQRLTILDDDPVEYSLGADLIRSEGDIGFAIIVTRSSDIGAATFDLDLTGSARTGGATPDFTRLDGENAFEDGQKQAVITYRIEEDDLFESDEQIIFELSNILADQLTTIGDATQTVTILDNTAVFSLSGPTTFEVSEAEDANRVFAITATRSSGVGEADVEILLTDAVGTPVISDLAFIGGSTSFADGETSTSALYRVTPDMLAEGDEEVFFRLSVVSSDVPAVLDQSIKGLTILDDDDPVEYSLGADLIRSEGDIGFAIIVTRSSDIGAATFDLDLTGSATTGGAAPDFTRLDGVNAFADGRTQAVITYRIEEDGQREVDERIFFELSNIVSDQLTTIGDATQTVAILDNTVLYSLGPDTVVSEADGTFGLTVTRSSDVGAAEIGLSLSGATGDITRIGGLNTFADGETTKQIIFRIEQDALVEPDETVDFTLSLVSSDQPALVDDSRQRLTILDDDEATFGGPIRGGSIADLIRGTQQADVIIGAGGADTLRGGGGGDTISGGAGADNIRGNGGADMIRGGGGADIVRSGSGADVVRAGGGADTVKGGGGADVLNGGGGADLLEGGGGRDVLTGKAGNDMLKGGGGADTFQFRASDRNDTILDFRQGQDQIEIQSGARTFESLEIEQDGRDVLIGFGAGQVRIITDNAGEFDESDFIF